MFDDIRHIYIVTCNGFNTEKGFYFKEITLFNQHIKHHWTLKIPRLEVNERKERNQIEFCTKYIHGLKYLNYAFDYTISQIKNSLIKLKQRTPEAKFVVKGDHNLKKFLMQHCMIECFDLENINCPKYDPRQIDKCMPYPFCDLHEREKCSYAKASQYFYWVLLKF